MEANHLLELPLQNSTVLVRVDFNVPLNSKGEIADISRILAAAPTIDYLLKKHCKVVLISHLGRPKGKEDFTLSLQPCVSELKKMFLVPVHFAKSCRGEEAKSAIEKAGFGEIVLLENVRFIPAEEKPSLDPSFAKELAGFADFFIFDAFATAHRLHSSTGGVVPYFPKRAAFGFLMQKELKALSSLCKHPKRPFYVVFGGSKISTKIGLVRAFLQIADKVFIGGGMSYTFLRAQRIDVGNSLVEESFVKEAKKLLESSVQKKLFLPLDHAVALDSKQNSKELSKGVSIKAPYLGVDIGPQTVQTWKKEMEDAATVFWNGPLGVYENPIFAEGTVEIARFLSSINAKVVVGGGDSAACVHSLGLEEKFYHISTGGGASLEFLESGSLPVIDLFKEKGAF